MRILPMMNQLNAARNLLCMTCWG